MVPPGNLLLVSGIQINDTSGVLIPPHLRASCDKLDIAIQLDLGVSKCLSEFRNANEAWG